MGISSLEFMKYIIKKTRSGCKVVVYEVYPGQDWPIHGAVRLPCGNFEPHCWTAGGIARGSVPDNRLDLILADISPKKPKRYVTIEGPNDSIYHKYGGKLHAKNRPAVYIPGKSSMWYRHGKLHNLEGPAIVTACGKKQWFIAGKRLSEEQFNIIVGKRNA